MRSVISILLLFLCGIASSQTPHESAKTEIAALFATLEQSNCEFNRNGSWYDAKKAADHLRGKYDYLTKKGMIVTAESFIELAASKSSTSGKSYLVRCDGKTPIESNAWFTEKLKALREATPPGTDNKP
jgi:hypothetical protein